MKIFISIFIIQLTFYIIKSYTCSAYPDHNNEGNVISPTSDEICCSHKYVITSNMLFCLNDGSSCPTSYPIEHEGNCLNDCSLLGKYESSNSCVDECPKLIRENKCIDSCNVDETIIFNKECRIDCPPNSIGTVDLSGFTTCNCTKTWYKKNGIIICNDSDECKDSGNEYVNSVDGTSECVIDCKIGQILFRDICYDECPGKFIRNDNECICPNYYYKDDDGLENCIEEDDEEYPFIVGETKEKVKNCDPSSTYSYRYSNKCVSACPPGTNSINNICSCRKYYYEDKNNNQICIETCPPNKPYFVYFEGDDEPKSCTNKCKDNFYFFNKNCYQKCPDNSYGTIDSNGVKICKCIKNWHFDNGQMICEDINVQCNTANNEFLIVNTNECVTSCVEPDIIIFNKKCYRECPANSDKIYNSDIDQSTCKCSHKWYKDEKGEIICLGENDESSTYNKLIIATNELVSDCSLQGPYNIEFNKTCISETQCTNPLELFQITNDDTTIKLCVCKKYYIEDENKNIICLNDYNCPVPNYKFKIQNTITGRYYCIQRCPKEYKEFNYECLEECPADTIEIINSNNLLTCQCINPWYFENQLMKCNNINSCKNVNGKKKYIQELNQCVNKCDDDIYYDFNNICIRECPINSEPIDSNGKKITCKCKYNWFNSNDEIICLGEGELNSNYPFLIEETKELVKKCSDSNTHKFQFNTFCNIECPENSKLKIDDNGEKVCVCKSLYAIDLQSNKICYNENVGYCGFDDAKNYPFTIQLDDKSQYCMKYCPSDYEYLFNKFCYKKCPSYLKINGEKKTCECINLFYFNVDKGQNICKDSHQECIDDGYYYLDTSNNECMKKCRNNKVVFDGYCVDECPDNAFFNKKNDVICQCIDKYEMEIGGKKCVKMTDNYDKNKNILKLIDDNLLNLYKKNKIIEINNLKIEICDIDKQKLLQENENKNLTLIDFTECEKILRTKYNIPNKEQLILVKIDINPISQLTITNAVEYLIYRKDGTILNLSLCENLDLKIIYPITNSTLANLDAARQLKEKNIDIYDPNSIFYFDFCSHYSINGTDIPLKQRREKIFVNVNACENNCTQENIDIYNEIVICNCKIKKKAEIDNDKIYFGKPENHFIDTVDNIINIKIVKCYKLLSDVFKNISNNMGFWIGAVLIFANFLLMYLYFRIDLIIFKSKLFKPFAGNPPILGKSSNRETSSSDREILKIFNSKDYSSNKKKSPLQKDKNENRKLQVINIKNFLKNDKKTKINEKKNKNDISIKEISNDKILDHSNIQNQETDDESIFQLEKYSGVTFEKAKSKRRKFFLISWFSIFVSKVEIITILFFRSKFELITILLSLFFFGLILDFTVNALMYTDDVASDTFDNGGGIDMSTSIALSLLSNLICYIIMGLITKLVEYTNTLELLDNEVKDEEKYNRYALKLIHCIKCRIIIYFIIQFIIMFCCVYYLYIFCCIYKSNQSNLMQNYFIGALENIIFPMILSTVICLLRYLAFKFNVKQFYYSANFIDSF